MRRSTFLWVLGALLVAGAAALLAALLGSAPAEAYAPQEPVRIERATLYRLPDGACYLSVTWDKKAGKPRYYMLERESPATGDGSGGVLPGALSLTAPQKIAPWQVRSGVLVIGPLSGAEIARCRVALASSLRGSKAVWVWSPFVD